MNSFVQTSEIKTLFLKSEFEFWLVEYTNVSVASSKSYGTYLQSAYTKIKGCKLFLLPEEEPFFYQIERAVIHNDEEKLKENIFLLFEFLSKNGIEEILGCSLKYIKNWQSALVRYGEFLFDQIANSLSNKKIENTSVSIEIAPFFEIESASDSVYDKKSLYKIFMFRLITQDRFYDSVFFPISFIKRIFYKRNEKKMFDEFINHMLDHTKVYYQEGYFLLKEIQYLNFTDRNVYIHHKNKQYIAYTKMSNNISLVPFTSIHLSKIALDHEKPMLTIINEKVSELTILREITEQIKVYIGKTKIDRKVLANISKTLFEIGFVNTINLENLKSELLQIAAATTLQLMDSSENSSKGTKFDCN